MYLSSNGAIVNVIHHDLDLHFQCDEIWNVNSSKTVKASKKCSIITFIKVDSRHRMESLLTLDFNDLELPFQCLWELSQKNASYVFYRGWFSTSNGTIMTVVLHDLALKFHDQTCSCYAFALTKIAQRMSPADLPRLARGPCRRVSLVYGDHEFVASRCVRIARFLYIDALVEG